MYAPPCTTSCGDVLLSVLDVKRLEQIDTSLSTFMQDSFRHWYNKVRLTSPSLPLPLAFGMAIDGGWSTKFSISSANVDGSLDIGILQPFVFLKPLSKTDFKLRAVDVGKLGLVNLRLLSVDLADSQSLRELALMDPEDGEFYLSPTLTLELSMYHAQIVKKEPFYYHINNPQSFLETIIRNVYEPEMEQANNIFDFETWQKDPIVETKIDTIPCVQCEGWPEIANKWPRKTVWPDKQLMDDVMSAGFHLVCVGVEPSEFSLSWRISFTRAEHVLMKTWNMQQRWCYLALHMFCRHKLSVKDSMWSYVIKTIMLWDSEECPPGANVWKIGTGTCMVRLLMRLRDVIQHGVCDHYFIEGCNILSSMTEPVRITLLESFDNAMDSVKDLKAAIVLDRMEKVSSLSQWYATKAQQLQHEEVKCAKQEDKSTEPTEGGEVSSIFTNRLLESTYETYVRVSVSTSKQDKVRAARSRSKFMHALVAIYMVALAVVYSLTFFSMHASLMVFLLFLVAGLLLNLGWSYRWCLCFIYSIVSLKAEWSLSWKVVHFCLSFPLAKFIAQMMGMFERPLEQQRAQKGSDLAPFPLTGTYVAKPGLIAPMLFLYGVNFLLMCASRARGLNNFWDVFVCALANQGHVMVFCPWMELFYREYNQLLVRLKPAICATVCTSLFVMFMLHFSDYTKSFWPWLSMTLLVTALCASMCCALPSYLAVTTCMMFAFMILLPARILYAVMGILYILHWMVCLTFPQSSPPCRTLRVLSMLSIHLCLQTTSLTAILTSVNMAFGCCMYVGWLHSLVVRAPHTPHTSLLHRLTSRLMVLIFIGGVALLTVQSKPVSTQEAFISVSAPVAAAMLLHSLEGSLLCTLVKLWKRVRARDGGVANHT